MGRKLSASILALAVCASMFACVASAQCQSNVCSWGTCIAPNSRGYDELCSSDSACQSTNCRPWGSCGCNGYDGWYTLEQDTILEDQPQCEGPVADVRTSADNLRSVLRSTG